MTEQEWIEEREKTIWFLHYANSHLIEVLKSKVLRQPEKIFIENCQKRIDNISKNWVKSTIVAHNDFIQGLTKDV